MNRAAIAALALLVASTAAQADDCAQLKGVLVSSLERQQQITQDANAIAAQMQVAAAANDVDQVLALNAQNRKALYEMIGIASNLKSTALKLQATPGYCGLKPAGFPALIEVADGMTTFATNTLSQLPK